MKKTTTFNFGLIVSMIALFVSSCGSNATFSKRYHNRGFNIAWGGGSDANNQTVKTSPRKAKAQTESVEVAKNVENAAIEAIVETEANAQVASNTTTIVSNTATEKVSTSAKMAKAVATQAIKTTKADTKSASAVKVATAAVKAKKMAADPGDGKSQMIALILCIFVGVLGIHRFYLGYTMEGVLMLLTGGGCGIWALIDLVRIITGDLQPKDGSYTETL